MTRELDKLFEKLGEQSKKTTAEPAEVIAQFNIFLLKANMILSTCILVKAKLSIDLRRYHSTQ